VFAPPAIVIQVRPVDADDEPYVSGVSLVRGSTYPIEIISRTSNGWATKWFDEGTGCMEMRVRGVVVQRHKLEGFEMKMRPGSYHLFVTMPKNDNVSIHVYGTVDGFPMRTPTTIINLRRS